MYQAILTIFGYIAVASIIGAVIVFGVGATLIAMGPRKAAQNMPTNPQLSDIEVVTEKGVEIC